MFKVGDWVSWQRWENHWEGPYIIILKYSTGDVYCEGMESYRDQACQKSCPTINPT